MTDYADLEKCLRQEARDMENHYTTRELSTEAADALASLTRELEEAKEVRDAMGAWAVQFLATDPAVGSVEAAAPYVQEIIRKNRAELRSIRAAKVGVDLSRAASGEDD